MNWLLVLILAVPAAGALFRSRAVATVAAAIAFAGTVALGFGRHDGGLTGPIRPWHELDASWVPGLNLHFHIGVDGKSTLLYSEWESKEEHDAHMATMRHTMADLYEGLPAPLSVHQYRHCRSLEIP